MIFEKESSNQRNSYIYNIIVFIVVYLNLSSLGVTLRISNEVYLLVSLVFYLFIYCTYSIINKKVSLNNKALLLLIFSYISIFLTMIYNQDFKILNIVVASQILMACLFVNIISFDDFIKAYVRVILFISIFSLIIMFIIAPFFKNISNLFPLRYNSTGLAVRDYIFGFHFESHSVASRRNTGIFREMGVYQHYLNVALLMYLFYLKENKLIVILILAFTIISTFSTPGIIFMLIIFIVYLSENYRNKLSKGIQLISAIILLFLLLNLIFPNLLNDFTYSLNKLFEQGDSYNGRLSSIIGNVLAWINSPIIGNGIEKGIGLAEELYLGQFTIHNTSTTTSFMAIYGIFFSAIMSIPLILLIFKLKIKLSSKIMLIFAFFLSINSERFIYDQLYYILVFSYFMNINLGQKVTERYDLK